MLKADCEPLYW